MLSSALSFPCALGPRISLDVLTSSDATFLAAACASLDPWRQLGIGSTALTAYLNRADEALLRLRLSVDQRPAGMLAVRMPWLRGPFIEALAVLPSFQGKGLGAAMVDWVVAAMEGLSPNLWASVSDFNQLGRRFWQRQGFHEVAPLPDLLVPGVAEILLRRQLFRG